MKALTRDNDSGILPKFISGFIMLDGISALVLGVLYFFSIAMTDYFELDATVGAMMRQRARFIILTAFVYQIGCVLSLVYWRYRKPYWAILLASLGAFHIVGLTLLRIMNDHFLMTSILTPSIYISVLINLLVLLFVYRENARVSSLHPRTGYR